MRPVRAELEVPAGAEIVNGRAKVELGHLEGRSNKIGQTFLLATPTDNRARQEWTLKAAAGSKLQLHRGRFEKMHACRILKRQR